MRLPVLEQSKWSRAGRYAAHFAGDVLKFRSKKNDVWFPGKHKTGPRMGQKGAIHHVEGTTKSEITQAF